MTRKSIKTVLYTFTALCLLFVSGYHQSFADTTVYKDTKDSVQNKTGWFIGLSGGWVWPQLSKSNTSVNNGNSAPPPNNLDAYSIHNPNSTDAFSLYVGYRFEQLATWFSHYSLGLRYQHVVSTQFSGSIQQYSLPAFTNYNYSVNVSSDIINLEGRINIYQYGCFSPYVSLGLGLASNEVTGYNEQPLAGIIPRNSPAYGNYSANNLMFNAGIGLDYEFTHQFRASLGYEYANLGNVKTSAGISTWAGESLSFGTLTNQAVILGVFYQLP